MSKRISKQQFAELLGIHEKTVERYIGDGKTPESREFREKTGFHKNEMNGRVSFDDRFARIFAANITGNDDLRATDRADDNIITVEDQGPAEIEKVAQAVPVAQTAPISRVSDKDFVATFLLPHKILLTPREAAQLTGLSQKMIREHSEKIAGKWKITRSYLQAVVNEVFANAKPTISKGKTEKPG